MTLGVEVGFMRYRGLRTGLVIGNGEGRVLTYLTDDQFESTFDGEKELMMRCDCHHRQHHHEQRHHHHFNGPACATGAT